MFFDPRQHRIWVHRDPVDLRKGHNGLSYLVTHVVMRELLGGAFQTPWSCALCTAHHPHSQTRYQSYEHTALHLAGNYTYLMWPLAQRFARFFFRSENLVSPRHNTSAPGSPSDFLAKNPPSFAI